VPALAFIARPESIEALPADARILPLSPQVAIPSSRLVAPSPEALLQSADFGQIERDSRFLARDWWKGTNNEALAWRSVQLGECFENELLPVTRDLLKASLVMERAIDQESATALVTDVPPVNDEFPPYPYLYGIGSLLQAWAIRSNLSFSTLRAPAPKSQSHRRSLLVRAYVATAARQALRHLRAGHPLVVVGPYRAFYEPIARAWSESDGGTVAIGSSHAPLRARPSVRLYFAPLNAFVTARGKREIDAFLSSALDALSAARSLVRDKVPAFEFVEQALLADIRARLRRRLPDLASLGIAFERGLDRAAHVLLMDTYASMAKAAHRYAAAKGVVTTVLQHGVIADPEGYGRIEANRVAAWGPQDAAWFRANLPPSTRIEATGNPRYDSLASRSIHQHPAIVRGLPKDARVLMFASAPFGHQKAEYSPWGRHRLHNMVSEAAAAQNGTILVVKHHPSEPVETSFPITDENASIVEIRKGDTFALILLSRLVMTLESSVALEAMYLERPVVFVGPGLPGSPFHPPEDGGGLRALSVSELSDDLSRLLNEPPFRERVLEAQKAYLHEHFAPLDGRAAKRLVTFLTTSD
jgi:hypothetical protein